MRKNSSTYPIELVADAFGESSVLADLLAGSRRVLLVADMNVVHRTAGLGTKIGRYVQAHGITLAGSPIVIGGGEKIKSDNLQSVFTVVSAILDAKLGRGDVVLALGGGTVLDVAGYAAAQVRGGVGLVRMPTTPAAMLGAAFATYAAVDSPSVKDALRVPSIPTAVVLDPAFATTVLDGVWRSGIGEAVRLAVAADATLLKKLEKTGPEYAARRPGALEELIEAVRATRAKKGDVGLALWAAHRLEAMSGYKLPHGYAVSIGVLLEVGAAVARGALSEADGARVPALLRACGALDGLAHSQHLLQQADSLLCGLDAWLLAAPEGVPALTALGKSETSETPDREAYRAAMKSVLRAAAESR